MTDTVKLEHWAMLRALPSVEREMEKIRGEYTAAVSAVQGKKDKGLLGFLDLPFMKKEMKAIRKHGEYIKNGFENLVVIGIGGSALGNKLLHNALNHPYYNNLPNDQREGHPRVFILDSIDSDHLAGLLSIIDLECTLFNIVTKSGTTVETMANFLIIRDMLRERIGPEKAKKNIIATTSASRGNLLDIAQREGYRVLHIPDNVGGRYSVLSAVGLLSAAASGVDIEGLLAGAALIADNFRNDDPYENPALMMAILQYIAYRRGKNISVIMPYSEALDSFGDWYCQLWAESLGKTKVPGDKKEPMGQTPLKAIGARDQHSLLQLFLDGPEDKIFTLIKVKNRRNSFIIPEAGAGGEDLKYLKGKALEKLLAAELKATESVLTERNRMNYRISLPNVSAFTIGQLIFIYLLGTAYMGELLGVNAFDQPAVEEGKKITYHLMEDSKG